MHIVLSGYFGFHNTGDEAILSSMIDQLRKVRPNIRITVLTNDEIHTTNTYGVESVNRWKLKDIMNVLKSADGLISGGGSLLQDATGPKSIIYYTTIMNLARWLKKPVFVYAQGMGPFSKPLPKKLVTYTLNRVARLTVRDKDSEKLLRSIGIRKAINIVPDPVLGMTPSQLPLEWLKENEVHKPFITISVREWNGKEMYVPKVAQVADTLIEKGYPIVFVPMHGHSDYEFASQVAKQMSHAPLIFPAEPTIEEKIRIIGASELLIGMRLHSLIFAAISETPFIPLSYDPKIEAFANQYEQFSVFQVEQDDWVVEDLLGEVERMIKAQQAVKAKLQHINQNIQMKALQTAAEAIRFLEQK